MTDKGFIFFKNQARYKIQQWRGHKKINDKNKLLKMYKIIVVKKEK